MADHMERHAPKTSAVELYCNPLGKLRIDLGGAKADQAERLAATINDTAIPFSASKGGFERGNGIPKGALYLHVHGFEPLSVRVDPLMVRNAEHFLENSPPRYGSQAALVASALNALKTPITAQVAAARGASKG